MNTNLKGQIGLASIVKDLTIKEYEVFLPIHDYSDVDLISINSKGISKRIQVKYRSLTNGRIIIPLNTTINGKKTPINRDNIDGWAVYNPEFDICLYVSVEESKAYKSQFSIYPDDINLNHFKSPSNIWEGLYYVS